MYYCIQMSMAEAPVITVRFTTVTALRYEILGNKASHILRRNSILFVLPLGNSVTTGFSCLGYNQVTVNKLNGHLDIILPMGNRNKQRFLLN